MLLEQQQGESLLITTDIWDINAEYTDLSEVTDNWRVYILLLFLGVDIFFYADFKKGK